MGENRLSMAKDITEIIYDVKEKAFHGSESELNRHFRYLFADLKSGSIIQDMFRHF